MPSLHRSPADKGDQPVEPDIPAPPPEPADLPPHCGWLQGFPAVAQARP
ncbi:hypothetical protein QRO11_07740 [Paracidovorax citrulli]|uniref:Uncharacterized protein n=1 Tax=Paracidovorax citrulli TaxID=80869 RepID=A0ABY9AU64_PARCI|nr:hypothetical protein [Paracidovorax citrulli]PVY66786.1 hypothetical protein C8E08_4208 [Paracidovorax citrulli]REG69050.1 hypothetical protein C8E07_2183 [Paracidovorax citrulli]RLJ93605.1 hypothetical protein C8E06_2183 [Paracidovorax citrulli]UEG47704.1 hypothetical protein LKW27_07530 [Paracidovorax citrulli]WIY30907.1 hypothetical protein QRO09_04045 [Paracidovorax citrulli]